MTNIREKAVAMIVAILKGEDEDVEDNNTDIIDPKKEKE